MSGRATLLVALVPAVFFGVLFVWPVGSILWRGLAPDGRPDLSALFEVLSDPRLRGVAWFTLWQAVVSTLLTVVIGLAGAYVVSTFEFRGRRLFTAAVAVPFVMPTVVVGTAFLVLLGPSSPLGWDLRHTVWAVLAAHVFFNVAVVVRIVGGAWGQLHPGPEQASRVLGAGPLRTWWEITLPRLVPALGAAVSIVFLFTFTSFGVVLVLGGPRLSTLESETYFQTVRYLNLDVAAALALVQLVSVILLLAVQRRLSERYEQGQRFQAPASRRRIPATWRQRLIVNGVVGFITILVAAPLVVLLWRSVDTAGGIGLGNFLALSGSRRGSTSFVDPGEAVMNSLLFGAAAAFIAVVVGGLAALAIARGQGQIARLLDTGLMLPLGTSAATVGFGFLITLDRPPLDLRGSVWLVPLAHSLIGVPFVVRVMVPAIRAVDDRLRSAARVLGASPIRVLREVDLPVVGRAAVVAASFAFVVSLGEFGATMFIARPDRPTIPTAIFRFLGQPGAANLGQAMAMSVILMVLTGAVVLVADRWRSGEVGQW